MARRGLLGVNVLLDESGGPRIVSGFVVEGQHPWHRSHGCRVWLPSKMTDTVDLLYHQNYYTQAAIYVYSAAISLCYL